MLSFSSGLRKLLTHCATAAAVDFESAAALNSSSCVAEVAYEQRAYSDGIRLPKNAKVLGAAVNPTTGNVTGYSLIQYALL